MWWPLFVFVGLVLVVFFATIIVSAIRSAGRDNKSADMFAKGAQVAVVTQHVLVVSGRNGPKIVLAMNDDLDRALKVAARMREMLDEGPATVEELQDAGRGVKP
jgi:hypothetical protein